MRPDCSVYWGDVRHRGAVESQPGGRTGINRVPGMWNDYTSVSPQATHQAGNSVTAPGDWPSQRHAHAGRRAGGESLCDVKEQEPGDVSEQGWPGSRFQGIRPCFAASLGRGRAYKPVPDG